MSFHFLALVSLPIENPVSDAEARPILAPIMAPYEPFLTPVFGQESQVCYCTPLHSLKNETFEPALEAMWKQFWGDMQTVYGGDIRERAGKEPALWDTLEQEWSLRCLLFYGKNRVTRPEGDPLCPVCRGTGTVSQSTLNPQARFNWCVLGGIWDGRFSGREKPQRNVFLFRLVDGIENVSAVITPDGVWHDVSRSGREATEILRPLTGTVVAAVDCVI